MRAQYAEQFDEFTDATREPDWYVPTSYGRSHPAGEQRINFRKIESYPFNSQMADDAKAIILNFLDGIITLYSTGEHTQEPLLSDTADAARLKKADNIFIGHGRSHAWKELKDFLHDRLGLQWIEFDREATAGLSSKERLETMLDEACFAFIVMTLEDEQTNKSDMVHTAGLFQGRLGFRRAIVLLEKGCEPFPNVDSPCQIRFSSGNISAKFEEIRRVLERERIGASPAAGAAAVPSETRSTPQRPVPVMRAAEDATWQSALLPDTKSMPDLALQQRMMRQRDVETLRRIFEPIHTPTMDHLFERISTAAQIPGSVVFFWNYFHGNVVSSSFHFYDAMAHTYVEKVHNDWLALFSYSDHFCEAADGALLKLDLSGIPYEEQDTIRGNIRRCGRVLQESFAQLMKYTRQNMWRSMWGKRTGARGMGSLTPGMKCRWSQMNRKT